MINVPSNMKMYPDTQVLVHDTADVLTGDGIFADTNLVRIQQTGWLLYQAVATATGDGEIFVPQLEHKEGISNAVPIANSGVYPLGNKYPFYKIFVPKGASPRILWDKATDTNLCSLGMFFVGKDHPVALNTPDILVVKNLSAATYQNVLDSTELEDCPYPGYLLFWIAASVATVTVQINQKMHRTGNVSYAPVFGSGLYVDIHQIPPYRTYVGATGIPTVTVTVPSGVAHAVAAFYVDWDKTDKSQIAALGMR